MRTRVLERELQSQIIELGFFYGWNYYHTHDSRRSNAGWPDLAMYKPGRFLMAELKTETGRVSEAQKAVLAGLEAAGVEVYLWRPSDLPDIARTLAARTQQGAPK